MSDPTSELPTPDYERGGVRLYCADCLDLLPKLPEGCVDAVVTDPPYSIKRGAAFVRRGGREVNNGEGDWNENGSWQWLLFPAWLREGGNVASFHKQGEQLPETIEQWHRFYLVKDSPPPTPRSVFVSAVEECSIGRKPGASRWFGGGYVPNYWRGLTPNRLNQSHGHPSEKPVKAIETLVSSLSDERECVCDPFMGSGTTGVACVKLGRCFIGIEKEPKYFNTAVKRIEQAFEDQALFDGVET